MDIQKFNYEINVKQAILWRFDNAQNLQKIIELIQNLINEAHTKFRIDWYNNVFNLLTANEFGLNIWAIILDQPLHVGLPINNSGNKWGFGKTTNSYKNYGRGNFGKIDNSVSLTLKEKRIILRLKAFKISSDCNLFSVNPFLKILFAEYGKAYITDVFNMQMKFKTNFDLSNRLKFFMQTFDLLPRPAGVKLIYETI